MKLYKPSILRSMLALVSILVLFTQLPANAFYLKMKAYEKAIEAEEFKIRWRKDRLGEISGSNCKGCETWRLKITKNTQAFRNNVLTDIKLIAARRTPLVVIFYDPKTNEVTRITW